MVDTIINAYVITKVNSEEIYIVMSRTINGNIRVAGLFKDNHSRFSQTFKGDDENSVNKALKYFNNKTKLAAELFVKKCSID